VGSAVSVDAYSSRLDALLGRFSALAQARPLGTPQAQCRTIGDADRRHPATVLAVFLSRIALL
jgi:hypothetical protein